MFGTGSALLLALASNAAVGLPAAADEASGAPSPGPTPTPIPQRWSVHVQSTNTQQYHGAFPAPYSGPQSLWPLADTAKTLDVTLYLGARLWRNAELYADPEIDQGFGLGFPAPPGQPYNGTFGVAGFVSGEAYKVGRDSMYGRVQRAFLRQTFDLGGGTAAVEPDINQLGGAIDVKHLVVTAGKISVTDVFDANPYAHDPKNDFLNWSIIDMGAFDYAADAWGFTYGVTAELASRGATVRGGLFQLSAYPNQIEIEHVPFRQYSPVIEYERRTSFLGGRPGSIKVLAYGDEGYMGSYADAVAAAVGTGQPPSTANVRTAKHFKTGAGLNVAQEIAPHVGAFARWSAMNGTWEAFEFADIDRSVCGGLSVDGALYHRPNDGFGVALVDNAISLPAQRYLDAGGVGILAGDGALSYGEEKVFEGYYKVAFGPSAAISADYQHVWNPAYNTVRGPASIYGLRYHVQI